MVSQLSNLFGLFGLFGKVLKCKQIQWVNENTTIPGTIVESIEYLSSRIRTVAGWSA